MSIFILGVWSDVNYDVILKTLVSKTGRSMCTWELLAVKR